MDGFGGDRHPPSLLHEIVIEAGFFSVFLGKNGQLGTWKSAVKRFAAGLFRGTRQALEE